MLTDGPLMVKFIEYYYEWLSQFDNALDVNRKLLEYNDVDTVPDKFLHFLKNEFMKSIPVNSTTVDQRFLIKHIKDFYKAKGTELAYRLLFRILYNEEISFYYPGRDILRASDGRWVIDKTLKVVLQPGVHLDISRPIRGLYSGATARISTSYNYIEQTFPGFYFDVTEIFLDLISGEFLQDEPIAYDDDETLTEIGDIISNGVIEYPGRYNGTYGFLSGDKYLQDNFYYQEYSYVINSPRSLDQYETLAKKLVHPAGTKLFGGITSVVDFPDTAATIVTSDQVHIVIDEMLIDLPIDIINEHAQIDDSITSILYFENVFDGWEPRTTGYSWTLAQTSFYLATHDEEAIVTHNNEAFYFGAANEQLSVYGSDYVADYEYVAPLLDVPILFIGTKRLLYSKDITFPEQITANSLIEIHNLDGNTVINRMVTERYSDQLLLLNDAYSWPNTGFDSFYLYSSQTGTQGTLVNINTMTVGNGTVTITSSPNTSIVLEANTYGITNSMFTDMRVVIGDGTEFRRHMDSGDIIQIGANTDNIYVISRAPSNKFIVLRDSYAGPPANNEVYSYTLL